jgi:hypothetical protein
MPETFKTNECVCVTRDIDEEIGLIKGALAIVVNKREFCGYNIQLDSNKVVAMVYSNEIESLEV